MLVKKSSVNKIDSLHLVDFGTVQLYERLQIPKNLVGTPSHMAPEVFNQGTNLT